MIFQCWREEEREVKLNFRFLLWDIYVEEDSFAEVLLFAFENLGDDFSMLERREEREVKLNFRFCFGGLIFRNGKRS